MKFRHPKFKLVFLGIDIVILSIAIVLSLRIIMPDFWSQSREHLYFGFNHVLFCLLLIVIYIISFRLNNLYKRKTVTTRYRHFILIIKGLFGGTVAVVLLMMVSNMSYFWLYGKNRRCIFYGE